jgi:RNA polymerase sigma-70 factor (ECF subfamily)
MKLLRDREQSLPGAAPSFTRVCQAAKSGDEDAVSTLYLDHLAMVYGYFRACGTGEPDDLASEVFLGMLRGLRRFNGNEADFRKWLMTIAHRRLVDHRRSQGRNRTDLSEPSSLEAREDGRSANALRAVETSPDLVDAFGQLTDAQREVLALRFVADLSILGVAAITGRPASAVKSLQNRGLQALRRHLSIPSARLEA